MKNFLTLVAIALACTAPAIATDQYVLKTITCPESVKIKLNAPDHIGSDPAFSPYYGSWKVDAKIRQISRVGQKITCSYRYDPAEINGTYSYTAKRNIISCEPKGTAALECKIEP